MRLYDHIVARVARSRPGSWFVVRVLSPLDRRIVRWSGGRLSSTFGTRFHRSTVLLTTTGATTGRARTTPLLATADGDRLVLVASYGGNPRHPAWYGNLKKTPRCQVLSRGKWRTYEASEADGSERERLWALAVANYAGYAAYQARVDRRIPVMVLSPADGLRPWAIERGRASRSVCADERAGAHRPTGPPA